MMQEKQTGRVVILLKISQTADGNKTYEVLQGKELETFLEYQKLTRALFQDYKYFDEREDSDNRSWLLIAPIKIKLERGKLLAKKKRKRNQANNKVFRLIRVIEYSDKSISYQEISGQRLKKFLKEISWVELVIQNYQLANQKIHWLKTDPVKVEFLKTANS